jgi:RimJ/RimL family protein N-acetyltransferase
VTVAEPIEGRLVDLVPLDVAAAEAWSRWLADPDTTRYLYGRGGRPRGGTTPQDTRAWGRRSLADPALFAVGIAERTGGRVIGNARIQLLGRRQARYSILIGEAEHRGAGQGTEATRLVCRYAFERLGVREIVLEVDPRNAPAVGAYRSAGFVSTRGHGMRLRAGELTG